MNEEHDIQVAVVKYLRMMGILVFAIPNGGYRCLSTARALKAEGVSAGVADLEIVLPNRVVFVEMKTLKGRQSESQKAFELEIKALGFEYYVWRSLDDAIEFVSWLN